MQYEARSDQISTAVRKNIAGYEIWFHVLLLPCRKEETVAANKIPERCCANCKYLLSYERHNAYGDIEHLCVRLGRFIMGIYKDIDRVQFYKIGMDKPDTKGASKCQFEKK